MPGAPATFTGPQTRCFCQEDSRGSASRPHPPAVKSEELKSGVWTRLPFTTTRLSATLSSPSGHSSAILQCSPGLCTCYNCPLPKAIVSLKPRVSFWTGQLAGPLTGFQGPSESGGSSIITNLAERSLVIQLLPKQVQLLLLKLLLTAHHVHYHTAVCIRVSRRSL